MDVTVFEHVKQFGQSFWKLLVEYKEITTAVAATTVIVSAGVLPRSAIVLGLRSKIFGLPGKSYSTTDRKDLLEKMTTAYQQLTKDSGTFIAVAGPKGVGKTCLVRTVVHGRFGVISVELDAGMDQNDIKAAAHRTLARNKDINTNINNRSSAQSVVTWHNRIFRCPPTIILEVPERQVGTSAISGVATAAREISNMGCRVIVDASDNALPISALETSREKLFVVDYMPREVLEGIQEFRPLFCKLKEKELKDVVWFVLGGCPIDYYNLQNDVIAETKDVPRAVEIFLQNRIIKATNLHDEAPAEIRHFFEQLKTQGSVLKEGIILPSPCKTLRLRNLPGKKVEIVPASPTMALVIRHEWKKVIPSLKELEELAKTGQQATTKASKDGQTN